MEDLSLVMHFSVVAVFIVVVFKWYLTRECLFSFVSDSLIANPKLLKFLVTLFLSVTYGWSLIVVINYVAK